jgi:hypothetical protein
MTESLEELRQKIRRQVPQLGRSPYSYHIVSFAVGLIEREYGYTEANKAIEDFGLEELGWSKVEPTTGETAPNQVGAKIDDYTGELRALLTQVGELSLAEDSEHLEAALRQAANTVRRIRHLRELAEREGQGARQD